MLDIDRYAFDPLKEYNINKIGLKIISKPSAITVHGLYMCDACMLGLDYQKFTFVGVHSRSLSALTVTFSDFLFLFIHI